MTEHDDLTGQLWTSRYQNKQLARDADKIRIVGITAGNPRFSTGYQYRMLKLLAPARWMFGIKSDTEFNRRYVEHLDTIGTDRIDQALHTIHETGGYRALVLCCFEDVRTEGEICHRTAFAEWWTTRTGIDVPEYPDPSTAAAPKPGPEIPGQGSLL